MNNNLKLNQLIENLPIVHSGKEYWLVRTSSGENYDSFLEGNYVAIGWNEIPLGDLHMIHQDKNNDSLFNSVRSRIPVRKDIENEISKQTSQTRALNQVLKFVYEIKRGDIIVIPSYNSNDLSFGEVEDTPVYQATGSELIECNFVKRKRVAWIKKNVDRNKLDFDLYKFIFAHQTINNVNDYADQINATIYDFYVNEKNMASLVLRVKKGHEIDAFEIGELYSDILYFLKEAAEDEGKDLKENPTTVKIDLQSPGVILLAGLLGFGLIFLGISTILAGGDGGINVDLSGLKLGGKFKANSLLDKFSDFLDRKQERQHRHIRFLNGLKHFDVAPNEEIEKLTDLPPSKSIDDSSKEVKD